MNSIWALVPFKEPPLGKSRLSDRLTSEQREVLAATMLDVVVTALLQSKTIHGLLIVSESTQLEHYISGQKNTMVLATQTRNLTDAVTQASTFATRELNCSTTFIVPADLPLITAEDIDFAMYQHQQITLIPDATFKGTNGIIATPPNVFSYVFNGQSFRKHQELAQATGLNAKSLQLENFSLDVDRFEDLMQVIQKRPNSRTATVYRKLRSHDPTLPMCGFSREEVDDHSNQDQDCA